jgi:hypothetical protein
LSLSKLAKEHGEDADVIMLTTIAQLAVGWVWQAAAAGDSDGSGGDLAEIPSTWPVECGVGDDLDGCSLVWLAAETGNNKILSALLEAGGQPGTPNHKKNTPLHVAVQRHREDGTAAVVASLLRAAAAAAGGGDAAASALADAKNANGLGALAMVCSSQAAPAAAPEASAAAAQQAQQATVEALIEGGGDPELGLAGRRTALWLAAAHGHVGAVRALLLAGKKGAKKKGGDGGSKVAAVNRRVCADGCGLSPLLIACQRGHAAVVAAMLDADSDGDDGVDRCAPSGPVRKKRLF